MLHYLQTQPSFNQKKKKNHLFSALKEYQHKCYQISISLGLQSSSILAKQLPHKVPEMLMTAQSFY